jgi:enterochelin esterase-like enzyme
MYIDSLKTVNGEEVSQKWRGEWGMFFFENMNARDRRRLFSEINKYGMEQAVPVTCPQCGKHWKARVNTANFFESALRSE